MASLLLDEYFEAEDERFLPELLASTSDKALVTLAKRWTADARPFARRMMLDYIDEVGDRAHHRPLIKRLFKHAEASGDDEGMARFAVVFDRLPRRRLRDVRVWDWTTRERREARVLVGDPAAPSSAGAEKAHRFSRRTRLYLARRAWRYFRRLGRKDPSRYVRAIGEALVRYEDADLAGADRLLDAWTLVHALYWSSPVVVRDPRGIRVARDRSLKELEPSPMYPDAWKRSFDVALRLLERARSHTVCTFLIAFMRRENQADLVGLRWTRVNALLRNPREEVQTFAVELLRSATGLERLLVGDWLTLVGAPSPIAVGVLCELFEKNIYGEQLTLVDCIDLARSPAAPVAELGLRWARDKTLASAMDRRALLALATARCPKVREEAIEWVVTELREASSAKPEEVRELLDSPHRDVRDRALGLLDDDERFGHSPKLWAALAESPYDDTRAYLIDKLGRAKAALEPGTLRHLWATALVAVHGGGRAKRQALTQIASRLVEHPGDAAGLLPLLGIALRSVRASERRAALAAVAQAAFRAPALRAAIARTLPELVLFPEEERTAT